MSVVAVEIEPPVTVHCPPHYWLIEKVDRHPSHWHCQRCGAQQQHREGPKLGPRWPERRPAQAISSSPEGHPA